MRMREIAALVVLLVAPAGVLAAESFERILFPLIISQHPGAYGTTWSTVVAVRNEGITPIEMFTSECYYRCSGSCVITMCTPGSPTPPRSSFTASLDRGEVGAVPIPATLLYVERGKADMVSASLRLLEESRGTVEYGVEIPIVRERELHTSALFLPSVPLPKAGEGRTHLRIFGVESPSDPVVVGIRAWLGDQLVWEDVVELLRPIVTGATPRPGIHDEPQPSYRLVEIPASIAGGETIRVEVEPLTHGLAFWAMASVTSNDTQHVTIVSPP